MKKILVATALAVTSAAFAQVSIGQAYKIPSDPSGTYFNLEIDGSGNMRTIVTRREGRSGTSFSKREVDCANRRFRYLGTGDTLGDMKASKADANMGPLTEGSISTYVAHQACAASPKTK